MEALRAQIRKATGELGREDQVVPGVVLLSGNKSGPVVQEAFGFKSLKPDAAKVDLDTTFWVASCTKLMTSIAALQLVEKGLVDLDEDITRVLHEWKDAKILTGFDDDGKPITRLARNKMTLRQLLTHSNGMSYSFLSQDLQKYRKAMGMPPHGGVGNQTLMETYGDPLLYEPGEGWGYSYATDWAGVVVERLGGCGRLQGYMIKNIWGPLGMDDATFHLSEREDLKANLIQMTTRTVDGALTTPATHMGSGELQFDSGGGGVYMKPIEFSKLLSSILRNDEVLLKKDTVEMMFTPQLSNPKYLHEWMDKSPMRYHYLKDLPSKVDYNWGLGGLLLLQDTPGRRKAGTLMWGGIPNLSWWIDRKSDLYASYSTQVLPPGDRESLKLIIDFENVLYADIEDNNVD
ncbi:hypothetical protein D9758_014589 [Tetrapyrgos nigripes]|uniref:Beta-lactamase-related domain-containing protein n=1 Tax=Tetrapyrgos nigripes TaxID=182062 RepID=A0A8H5FCI6_9AGAR|nr:hypothetical protein D9758_014589 [Tetrapyrgos nigripes]